MMTVTATDSGVSDVGSTTGSNTGTGGGGGGGGGGPPPTSNTSNLPPEDREQVYRWIQELGNPDSRETALLELSKKRVS